MAIAKMKKLTLLSVKNNESDILNCLHKTGAVELTKTKEYNNTCEQIDQEKLEELKNEREKYSNCLDFLTAIIDGLAKERKEPSTVKDGFEVKYEEFINAFNYKELADSLLNLQEEKNKEILLLKTDNAKLELKSSQYSVYKSIKSPFSHFANTKYAVCYLGYVKAEKYNDLSLYCKENEVELVNLSNDNGNSVISLVALKSKVKELDNKLAEVGFNKCGFSEDKNAEAVLKEIDALKKQNEEKLKAIYERIYSEKENVRKLKVYIDYIDFLIEKHNAKNNFKNTNDTFLLEGYVPESAKEEVENKIKQNFNAVYMEFNDIKEGETAPILMKNNKVVKNFEFVTNLYSPPQYGGFDPNAVMGFFFCLFMGFIMADVVYGLLMLVGGLLFAKSLEEGGTKKLANVIAYGGIFTILFGVLFDSWLGFDILRMTLGQDYVNFYNAYLNATDSYMVIAGISIPSLLIWSLALGVVQIIASLICKAIICFKRGEYLNGVVGGIAWSLALVGLLALCYGMISSDGLVTQIGTYVAVGFAVVGILGAGFSGKGIEKFTKSFGQAYGIINYASDILSYARLYGLMLSGSQIASIFTKTLAVQMLFPLGIGGIIGGLLVIIAGHAFNLAMGVLGAYIHDSRLQYIEFFGRFYEGEGQLFNPIASKFEHVKLTK